MLGLSASYLKEYFQASSIERNALEQLERKFITRAVSTVQSSSREKYRRLDTGVVVATALLEHHAILNQSFYQGAYWTLVLFPLLANPDPCLDANVIMASGAIFAKTMLPRCGTRPFQQVY